ncbi:TPR repeat-containing serine/threonine protein kinase [Calothrix sp. NIES-4071]|nr:TPR repeat-containing serine/threonine protein kinase [Calothrix sp. NIES-4071]BAZ61719.1 TPR repeat-containing serine/threonine protein kinase [Calothrix sp. NIES-4105]
MLGSTLALRYQIISCLGGGGFGETYVACDTQLPGTPQCVVKKLKPQSNDPETLQTARRLFDTEAQVLYQLGTHKQIPQLRAYFEENQEFYLVQEFIEGHDLGNELIPGKVYSQEQVILLLQEILEILKFVHQNKVIHRDLNPRNILRNKHNNKLFLIDFGAVKQITTNVVTSQSQKFTVAIGTPGYIPSEQAQGNPRYSSDIYALGIIGIQALTGIPPEQLEHDDSTSEIIWRHQTTVSEELAAFLDKMVRYDFRQRYQDASIALQALKDLNKHQSAQATIALAPASPIVPVQQHIQPINYIKLFKSINIKAIATKTLTGIAVLGCVTTIYVFVSNAVNSNNSNELYKQANTLYDLQRYNDALNTYQKAVEIRADYSDAWYGKGKALYELKRYKDALSAYDKSIQISPNNKDAWKGRGFTLDKLNRESEAIASYNKALTIQPNDFEVWNALGESNSDLKRYDDAIKAFDKAVEIKPDYYQSWFNKGKILHTLKRYDDAIGAYDKTIELKPSYEAAWYNKGNALINLQRYQDAFNAYDKAVQLKPDYVTAWISRSNTLLNLRRYPEALDSFNQVVKYDPDNISAFLNRGWLLHQQQQYEQAVQSYDKAIVVKRNDYQAWYNRGNSLFSLKRYSEAVASYNRAIRYEPSHYESWYSRGNSFFNMQRFQDAIASYEHAVKLKPDYQQAINALKAAQAQQQLQQPQQIIKR